MILKRKAPAVPRQVGELDALSADLAAKSSANFGHLRRGIAASCRTTSSRPYDAECGFGALPISASNFKQPSLCILAAQCVRGLPVPREPLARGGGGAAGGARAPAGTLEAGITCQQENHHPELLASLHGVQDDPSSRSITVCPSPSAAAGTHNRHRALQEAFAHCRNEATRPVPTFARTTSISPVFRPPDTPPGFPGAAAIRRRCLQV
jgi:hypothetical protein